MIYPISIYGSSVLRSETSVIDKDFPGLERLISDMFETMYNADGVGLAAPQIGKSLRLFVVDASPLEDEEPSLSNFKRVFINPEIYERSEEECVRTEGCLSLPGLNEDVLRPISVRMRYLDDNFAEHDELFTGFAARVVQHEYDHLEKMVFTDRVSPLRKTLIKSKLLMMSKGKYKVGYRNKLDK